MLANLLRRNIRRYAKVRLDGEKSGGAQAGGFHARQAKLDFRHSRSARSLTLCALGGPELLGAGQG